MNEVSRSCKTCGGTGTVEKTPTISAWSEHGDREQEACPDCDGPRNLDEMIADHGDMEGVFDELTERVFTNCNVCGRELIMTDEESCGMCQICEGE